MVSKIEWSVIPAVKNKLKTILVSTFIIAISIVVFFFWSKYLGFLAFVVLFLSVLPYYTRTHYIVDEEGITIKGPLTTQRKKWSYLKKVIPDKNGIFLSPFNYETRLENYRGFLIKVPEEKKDEIYQFILGRISKEEKENKQNS